MSERTNREFLGDIREALQRISVYVTGLDYEAFVKDTRMQDAVIRNLQILGEATKTYQTSFAVHIQMSLGRTWPLPATG